MCGSYSWVRNVPKPRLRLLTTGPVARSASCLRRRVALPTVPRIAGVAAMGLRLLLVWHLLALVRNMSSMDVHDGVS